MAGELFLFFLVFAAALVFERLPILAAAEKVLAASRRSYRILRDPRFSDHWKEVFLRRNAWRSLAYSLRLSGWIAIFLLVILLPLFLADRLFPDWAIFPLAVSGRGLLVSVLPVLLLLAYRYVRKRLSTKPS